MLDTMSEKVLQHITHYQLTLFQGEAIPNFQSHINKIDDVPPQYVRDIIKQLNSLGYINVTMNAHRIGTVSLTHLGISYFENLKNIAKEKHIKCIREWLNVGIAFLALIVAIIALFI